MAGKKGAKGGGGARPNSGPQPRKTDDPSYVTDDPDEFLRAAMRDPTVGFKDRLAAALALKRSASTPALGKKQQAAERAKELVGSRSLAPTAPPTKPRLVAVK